LLVIRRALSASFGLLGVAVLVGCVADPPADLSHLPRDANAVWGIDVAAAAAWAGTAAPGPLAQLGSQAWIEGIEGCGLDLEAAAVTGTGSDPSDVVLVVRGSGLGATSTLECLGAAAWRSEASTPYFTVDGSELLRADGTAIGRVISKDAVVIATNPAAHDLAALAEGSEDAFDDPMREALAAVDFRSAIWGAVVVGDDTTSASGPRSVVLHASIPGDLVVHASLRASDPDETEAIAKTLEAKLEEVAGWVYAPPAVVDHAEIEAKDDRVELRMTIALSQWQGMDLRFVDERRGVREPPPESEPVPEPEPIAAAIDTREAVAVAVEVAAAPVGPTGVAACDEYLEKYRACIEDKVPEAARKAMTEALDTTVDAWKQAAAGPGAAALETGCKAASEAAAQATAAMGCTW
jgi:hypothetical protein